MKNAGQLLAESLQSGRPLDPNEIQAALQSQADELNSLVPPHLRAPVRVIVQGATQRPQSPHVAPPRPARPVAPTRTNTGAGTRKRLPSEQLFAECASSGWGTRRDGSVNAGAIFAALKAQGFLDRSINAENIDAAREALKRHFSQRR